MTISTRSGAGRAPRPFGAVRRAGDGAGAAASGSARRRSGRRPCRAARAGPARRGKSRLAAHVLRRAAGRARRPGPRGACAAGRRAGGGVAISLGQAGGEADAVAPDPAFELRVVARMGVPDDRARARGRPGGRRAGPAAGPRCPRRRGSGVAGPRAGSKPPSVDAAPRGGRPCSRPLPRSPTVNGKRGWSGGGSRRSKTRRLEARASAPPKPSNQTCAGVSSAPGRVSPAAAPTRSPRGEGPASVASQSRSTSTSSSAKTTISPLGRLEAPCCGRWSRRRMASGEQPDRRRPREARRRRGRPVGRRPSRCRRRSPRSARSGSGERRIARQRSRPQGGAVAGGDHDRDARRALAGSSSRAATAWGGIGAGSRPRRARPTRSSPSRRQVPIDLLAELVLDPRASASGASPSAGGRPGPGRAACRGGEPGRARPSGRRSRRRPERGGSGSPSSTSSIRTGAKSRRCRLTRRSASPSSSALPDAGEDSRPGSRSRWTAARRRSPAARSPPWRSPSQQVCAEPRATPRGRTTET